MKNKVINIIGLILSLIVFIISAICSVCNRIEIISLNTDIVAIAFILMTISFILVMYFLTYLSNNIKELVHCRKNDIGMLALIIVVSYIISLLICV